MFRSLGKDCLHLLPFIILLIGFFYRLFYPHLSLFMIPDYGISDVLHLNLPLKDFLDRSLHAGQWPLWSNQLGTGFPVLAEGQIGTFYSANLLLFRFLPTVLAYNISVVGIFLCAGLGMYVYARVMRFSRLIAGFGAMVFAFNGFFSVHLNHFNLIQTAAFIPWIFTATELLIKKPSLRFSILLALLLSQQLFAGYYPLVFVTLFGTSIYSIGRLYRYPRRHTYRVFLFLITSSILTVGLSAIQLFPTFELWQRSSRQSGLDFDVATNFPYPIAHVLTFLRPYFFGSPANGTYPKYSENWGIFWENTAYLGIIPLLLAGGSIGSRRKKTVFLWGIIVFLSFLLVFGRFSPIYFIFTFFPFTLFRVPSRFLLLSAFSLTILALVGLEHILAFSQRKWTGQRQLVILCLAVVWIGTIGDEYLFSYQYPPISPSTWWTTAPAPAAYIHRQESPRITDFAADYQWNAVFLTQGWQTMTPYRTFRNALGANSNLLFDIAQVDVYTGGLMPRRMQTFKRIIKSLAYFPDEKKEEMTLSTAAANLLSLEHTTEILSPYHLSAPGLSVAATFPPLFIYHNTNSLPRPFFVYQTKQANSVPELLALLATPQTVSQPIGIVEDAAAVFTAPESATGTAQIVSETPSTLAIAATTSAPGLLVISDSYYPGWVAKIDGQVTPIIPVNVNARGIWIPSGEHTLQLSYEPAFFWWGKITTVVFVGVTALLAFLTGIRVRKRPRL